MYNMMYNFNYGGWGWGIGLLVPLMLWSLFWKAWALWLAARKGQKIWFGALLIFNTVGILEIVYIFLFSGEKFGQKKMESPKNTPPSAPMN
ncbi:MAG: Membrane protein [Candidatus Magasanikbacteria bacterium GW2011_GWC2_40_17]|uniref:Membrane protein n=1 Tax=Candidatus Magasanikbacteria bacterium GW2011_GWA2_42_32 TaxID=1619039 RepID=A0A0G1D4N8_9BACT|nr:MAG: Membrane protein [Candidatus Magasanikbacteria bacterium GW2011_GWC2_40_17]KKS56998.1 MAG: Membrane protein [Candidatus Magasanikbacteria bacterium GW2011_GWA2_42_32]